MSAVKEQSHTLLCPACGDHFRELSRFHPIMLNCYHTFCRGCVDAMLAATTDAVHATCHICFTPIVRTIVNDTLALFSESVFAAHTSPLDAQESGDTSMPTYQPIVDDAARQRARTLANECTYAANKLRAEHQRFLAEQALMNERFAAIRTAIDDQLDMLVAHVHQTRDARIEEAHALYHDKREQLLAQVVCLRETVHIARLAYASDDAHAMSTCLERFAQTAITAVTPPLVDIVGVEEQRHMLLDSLSFHVETHICADNSIVFGDMSGLFIPGDCPAARANNNMFIACRNSQNDVWSSIQLADVHVEVAGADGRFSKGMDAAVHIHLAIVEPGLIQVQYIVTDDAVDDFLLFVHVTSVSIPGSPFTRKRTEACTRIEETP